MGDLYVKTALKRDQNGNVMIENNTSYLKLYQNLRKLVRYCLVEI